MKPAFLKWDYLASSVVLSVHKCKIVKNQQHKYFHCRQTKWIILNDIIHHLQYNKAYTQMYRFFNSFSFFLCTLTVSMLRLLVLCKQALYVLAIVIAAEWKAPFLHCNIPLSCLLSSTTFNLFMGCRLMLINFDVSRLFIEFLKPCTLRVVIKSNRSCVFDKIDNWALSDAFHELGWWRKLCISLS